MEIYVGKRGSEGQEKLGPFTRFALKERLESGEISGDDLGWERGMDDWIPLREFDSLNKLIADIEAKPEHDSSEPGAASESSGPPPIPLPDESAALDPRQEELARKLEAIERNATRVHPFRRGFARLFDACFIALVLVVILQPMEADPSLSFSEQWQKSIEFNKSEEGMAFQRDFQLYYLVALLAWVPVEALLLSMFGTTPGKAIFGLYVEVEGSASDEGNGMLPAFFPALGRSLIVWLLGFGAGLPFFALITMAIGFFQLMTRGSCLWDRRYGTEVVMRPPTVWRFVLAFGLFLSLLLLSQLAALTSS